MASPLLDYRKFKHVKSDKHSTTLRHEDGHLLKIAHRGLKPDSLAQLQALNKVSAEDETPDQAMESIADKKTLAMGGLAYGGEVKGKDDDSREEAGNSKFDESRKSIKENTLDYNKIRKEKREGNTSEGRKPVMPDGKRLGFDDGGRVPAPIQGNKDSQGDQSKQEKPVSSNVNTPSSVSEAVDRLKNFWNEGGKVKKYAEGTPNEPIQAADDSSSIPPMLKAPDYDPAQAPAAPPVAQAPKDEAKEESPSFAKIVGRSAANAISPELALLKGLVTLGTGVHHFATEAVGAAGDQLNKDYPVPSNSSAQPSTSQGGSDASQTQPSARPPQPSNVNPPSNPNTPDEASNTQTPSPQPSNVPQAAPTPQDKQLEQNVTQQTGNPAPEQTFHDTKSAELQKMQTEDAAWQHDLANQHITPKTYGDLFADKSTLGKISSVFGMLLSGAGSGLSGQPNMAMKMMDNIISNDLEAQKQSKANAQNFLRLHQQKSLNDAQITNLAATSKNINAEAALKSWTMAKVSANNAALHHLIEQRNKFPQGSPQRQRADETIAMLNSSVQNENFNLMDRAASASAYYKMVLGNEGGSSGNPAEQIRKKQLLGIISPEQGKAALKEIGDVENHVQNNQQVLKSFDDVANMSTTKNYIKSPIQNKARINAEWDATMDKFVKDNEGRVTPQTIELMHGLRPAVTDDAQTTALKRQKMSAILNAGFATPTLDSFGIKLNKGEFSNPKAQEAAQVRGQDGKMYTKQVINGKSYMIPSGG